MELPTDEEPTIATVSDLEKLKDQPFFKDAKEGDTVLIYDKAAKIILYDPVANKIVNAASNNIADPTAATTDEAPAPTGPASVAIYNGTDVSGLTRTVEADITEKLDDLTVVLRDNAAGEYDNTIVVDLTGSNAAQAKAIALAVKGDVDTLPSEETEPIDPESENDVDILIIVGTDYTE